MYMFGFRIPALTCVKRPTVQVSFWTTKYHISIDSTRMSTALHICRQLLLVMVCISPAVSHSVHSSHPWGSPTSPRCNQRDFAYLMSLYYVSMRTRPDILAHLTFLTSRISDCRESDRVGLHVTLGDGGIPPHTTADLSWSVLMYRN
jgi:hypothetical protein